MGGVHPGIYGNVEKRGRSQNTWRVLPSRLPALPSGVGQGEMGTEAEARLETWRGTAQERPSMSHTRV